MDAMQAQGASDARKTSLVVVGPEVDGRPTDIVIAGDRIAALERHDPGRQWPDEVRRVDGTGMAALPGLMNAHTHSAMAIMRSLADDMPLMPWLQQKIWPLEARLTEADVYWGARLACLEMIRTGTVFCSDMYWHFNGTARALQDAGLRGVVAGVLIDQRDPDQTDEAIAGARKRMTEAAQYAPRIGFAIGPHAVYTVSERALRWAAEQSAAHDVPVHIHLSETAEEVEQCVAETGLRPVRYLERLGLLGPRLVIAHGVHLDDDEIALLAEHEVSVVHNPVSNLKLASGGPMRYRALRAAGVRVLIGTDGAASNNNLDLLEELKFAALMAKHATGDPTVLPADEALALATTEPAAAFRVASGVLAPGRLADLMLVDLDHPMLFPGHDLAADLVYAANGRPVRTVICDGRVLMEDGQVADEAEIRAEVRARLARLLEG